MNTEFCTAINAWVMYRIKLMNQEVYNKSTSLDVTIDLNCFGML